MDTENRIDVAAPSAVYYALASNVVVAACKYGVALYTNSGSALAEAVHPSADCLNQIAWLMGHRSSRARRSRRRPRGNCWRAGLAGCNRPVDRDEQPTLRCARQHRRTREAMHAWLAQRPEVKRIVSLIVLKWSDDLLIAIQAELEPHDDANELVCGIDRIENGLRERFPPARWIFFEPELREHGRHPL